MALPSVVAILGTTTATAGAIFTTDAGCVKINGNIYAAKTDIWLDGGTDGNGSALEPNTEYCILVSAPGGTLTLNTIECRKTTDSSGHFELDGRSGRHPFDRGRRRHCQRHVRAR